MSVPKCPTCSTPVPMKGNFNTSHKRPLSDTCASCGEEYPDSLLPDAPVDEMDRESRIEVIRRALTGE